MQHRQATCTVGARAGSYGGRLPSTDAFQNRYKPPLWQALAAPVPSAQLLSGTGMSAITASELQQRLSEQLQALSQVGETLTLRLLELEERLGSLEEQLLELDIRSEGQGELSADTGELLAATEERIARLEDLLASQGGGGNSGRGSVQPLPLRRPERNAAADATPGSRLTEATYNEGSPDGEPELELDPFPQEEEQPFMDELSA